LGWICPHWSFVVRWDSSALVTVGVDLPALVIVGLDLPALVLPTLVLPGLILRRWVGSVAVGRRWGIRHHWVESLALVVVGLDSPALFLQPFWSPTPSPPRVPLLHHPYPRRFCPCCCRRFPLLIVDGSRKQTKQALWLVFRNSQPGPPPSWVTHVSLPPWIFH